ncbi:hypothetical protein K438DRAFT_1758150 [Mycena galopus ATCC 62051]|nr:hypothetical protein K438DRAFT_1758150 [Mycena galopus ATCC 62051]
MLWTHQCACEGSRASSKCMIHEIFYEVDLDTYTCQCNDFPLISFCKHLCGVQCFFPDINPCPDAPSTPIIPDTESHSDLPSTPIVSGSPLALDRTLTTRTQDVTFTPTPEHDTTLVAEKVERVAARIRRSRQKGVYGMQELVAICDSILKQTDDSDVLPASSYVPANSNSGKMMPKVKTKAKRGDKDAYGAGKASGGKTKEEDGGKGRKRAKMDSAIALPEARQLPATALATFSSNAASMHTRPHDAMSSQLHTFSINGASTHPRPHDATSATPSSSQHHGGVADPRILTLTASPATFSVFPVSVTQTL